MIGGQISPNTTKHRPIHHLKLSVQICLNSVALVNNIMDLQVVTFYNMNSSTHKKCGIINFLHITMSIIQMAFV